MARPLKAYKMESYFLLLRFIKAGFISFESKDMDDLDLMKWLDQGDRIKPQIRIGHDFCCHGSGF